jgi:SAM-dependent methyltransferase
MTNAVSACGVCGNPSGNQFYKVQEMFFGTRDVFDYFQCGQCGCLQINEIPRDLAKYYPNFYYSHRSAVIKKQDFISEWISVQRSRYWLATKRDPLRKIFAQGHSEPNYYSWFRKAGVTHDSRILDVGCGTGQLLLALREQGFRNLVGIDPYVENIKYPNGVTVRGQPLDEAEGGFDLIMLHHSFEHMANPRGVMKRLFELLNADGRVLIRIPLADSMAWRRYGVNWVQLDAPRHLFLHTRMSMGILSDSAGFEIGETLYDSNAFQFWGSELYLRGIPLKGASERDLFTDEQIKGFQLDARRANKAMEGDQACFILSKRAGASESGIAD